MMTPDHLREAGTLLFGDEWQRPLARLLGPSHPEGPRETIDPRLVQRWVSSTRDIPDWVAPALSIALDERANAITTSARRMTALSREIRIT
jgi:hypothetical protein